MQLRETLACLEADALKWALPRVLEDLLDTHTNDPYDDQDLGMVLMHLNALSEYPDSWYEGRAAMDGNDAAIEDRRIDEELGRRNQLASKDMSAAQKQAIHAWLLLARTWKDSELYQDDIDAALRYWGESS